MRTADELLASGLAVIDEAYLNHNLTHMIPLFSGGHDSYCACYVASCHPRFNGTVFHIDTRIGSFKTKQFVQQVCTDEGWKLSVYKSVHRNDTYEYIVRNGGFPGPPQHALCYHRLKKQSISRMTLRKKRVLRRFSYLLITGARQQESVRRMGHIEKIRVGDARAKGVLDKNTRFDGRIWCNPCYDWSSEEQREFMNSFRLDRNPVKDSPLGMSGECFCGAFAAKGELELIKEHVPDVWREIDRLSKIAKSLGVCAEYGGPPRKKLEVLTPTGPLCSSCDRKATRAGIRFVDLDPE